MNEKEKVATGDVQNTPAEKPQPQEKSGTTPEAGDRLDVESIKAEAFQEAIDFLTQTKEGRRFLADIKSLPSEDDLGEKLGEEEGSEESPTKKTAKTKADEVDLEAAIKELGEENPTLAKVIQKMLEITSSAPKRLKEEIDAQILAIQEQIELQKINKEINEIKEKYPDASEDQIKTAMMIQKALLSSNGDIDQIPPLMKIYEDLRRSWGGNEEKIKEKLLAEITKSQNAPITEGAGVSSTGEEEPKTFEDYARLMEQRFGIKVGRRGI